MLAGLRVGEDKQKAGILGEAGPSGVVRQVGKVNRERSIGGHAGLTQADRRDCALADAEKGHSPVTHVERLHLQIAVLRQIRSEERRVGKECRERWGELASTQREK